ncbi:hypothetical protein BD309DRAFT_964466 [Dichomitus squalens]|nr:hypothetical protein BD309DRAFT_964466 [Dichomitus squalens]
MMSCALGADVRIPSMYPLSLNPPRLPCLSPRLQAVSHYIVLPGTVPSTQSPGKCLQTTAMNNNMCTSQDLAMASPADLQGAKWIHVRPWYMETG